MALLRELIGMEHLKPLHNNILCALLTLVYVKIYMEISSVLRIRLGKVMEARRFIHVCDSSLLIFWPLFDANHWSWRLNVLVPVVMAVRIFYKGAILRDPGDHDVRTLSVTSSPTDLIFGPLQFKLLMVVVGLYKFMTEEGAVIMAAVGIGDGIAPVVGIRYGRHRFRMPLSNTKTMEGSMFVFLGTIAGCYIYTYALGLSILPLRIILAYGAIASCVEASSPGTLDNIIVPVVLHVFMERVKEWLPA